MKLELIREKLLDDRTIGKLYIDGKYFTDTLEDKDRGLDSSMPLEEIKKKKVYGETAIPKGTYNVIYSYSPKFKKNMPLLLDVKGYEGIRIHSGSKPEHSLGCILIPDKQKKEELYKLIEKDNNTNITIK